MKLLDRFHTIFQLRNLCSSLSFRKILYIIIPITHVSTSSFKRLPLISPFSFRLRSSLWLALFLSLRAALRLHPSLRMNIETRVVCERMKVCSIIVYTLILVWHWETFSSVSVNSSRVGGGPTKAVERNIFGGNKIRFTTQFCLTGGLEGEARVFFGGKTRTFSCLRLIYGARYDR